MRDYYAKRFLHYKFSQVVTWGRSGPGLPPEGLGQVFSTFGTKLLFCVLVVPETQMSHPGTRFKRSLQFWVGKHNFRIGLERL